VGVFDPDQFVQACVEMLDEHERLAAIREVLERAVSDCAAIEAAYPVPLVDDDGGILYRSDALLISNVMFPSQFRTSIHDHTVAAAIGVWGGFEDNRLFERSSDGVRENGATRVEAGEVIVLEADAIHQVLTPSSRWSGALHVYLGDITSLARSKWTTPSSAPSAYDGELEEQRWAERAIASGLLVDGS
jgi:predicted metal-dependent enzyme (double-stranded beta helix superfamily)